MAENPKLAYLISLGNCFWRKKAEVALGSKDNKPVEVVSILGPKNLPPYDIAPGPGVPSVGSVVFQMSERNFITLVRWRRLTIQVC